jgi:hypothetical protein
MSVRIHLDTGLGSNYEVGLTAELNLPNLAGGKALSVQFTNITLVRVVGARTYKDWLCDSKYND